ncbi:TetR/AcrR family transcriptional regulator [Clostridium sp. BJN0013]|uniref:TetR/AcrR family transcriptional regulator n=1 Tax=Clostridium sp. BJN0013 TaxID=3236840 RepID=UPI0034C5BE80
MLNAFKRLSEEKQVYIINAAADIFGEEGFHHASISRICKKAGISNGALYKYFENKEALYFVVVDYITHKIETEVYKKYIDKSESIFDDIHNFLRGLKEFIQNYPNYIVIYCDFGSSSMNRFAERTSEKFRIATSLYTIRMVEHSKKRNEIDNNIKNEVAAYLIDNYFTIFAYTLVAKYHNNRINSFFSMGNRKLNDDEIIDWILESLKETLKKR